MFIRFVAVASVVASASALVACTSLLGDFTVGGGSNPYGGGDAGRDAQGGGDAQSEAGPHTFVCNEDTAARTTLAPNFPNDAPPSKVWTYARQLPDGHLHAQSFVAFSRTTNGTTLGGLEGWDLDTQMPSVPKSLPIISESGTVVLNVKPTASGLAALAFTKSSGNFSIFTLRDGDKGWDRYPLTYQGKPNDACLVSGDFLSLSSNNDYLVLASYVSPDPKYGCQNPNGLAQLFTAKMVAGAPGNMNFLQAPSIKDFMLGAPEVRVPRQALAMMSDGSFAAMVLPFYPPDPGAPGLPPFKSTSVFYALDSGGLSSAMSGPDRLQLNSPATSRLLGLAVGSATGGLVNVGFAGGDVTDPSLFVGQAKAVSLATLNVWADVRKTPVQKLAELPLINASARWYSFPNPGSEDLLAVAPGDGSPGVNLYWFTQDGALVTSRRATEPNRLFASDTMTGVDVTFHTPPKPGTSGDLAFAFTEPASGGYAVVYARAHCQ
jgi:hypothetical protein